MPVANLTMPQAHAILPINMTHNRSTMTRPAAGPDGIGCVGMLLLLGCMVVLLLALVRPDEETAAGMGNGSLAARVGLLAETTVPASASDTPLPAATDTATATSLPTSTRLSTATWTPTATWIPTATWTPTAAPPTAAAATTSPLPPLPTATYTPMPLPTPIGTISWTLRVPMLMYHYISTPPEDADKYRVDLSVEPEAFRAQMAYLAENGYTTIDLYDLSLAIVDKKALPPKPVIITLDDGYRDNYENAFPILQAYGQKATFFIVTDFVDQGAAAYMTWAMLEEMAAAGMRLEPHSKSHPDLRERDHDFLVWQILGSQETLAAHIGYQPRFFAYPGGRYDDAVLEIMPQLHFWGAVTTAGDWWHSFNNRYEWPRLRVRHTTTLPEFIDLLQGGQ